MSALIQADLARLGIKVNLATLESRALLSTINESLNYEACLLAIVSGDTDPTSHVNILSSRGMTHWWRPRQAKPATDWEARIDDLMKRQMSTLDPTGRKKLFDEAQTILAEQQPFIFLVSRHLIVASKTGIGNLQPALLPDFVLWNCEELYRQ
jgi:peptide/nickel transport system substrate-binding protein